jgi:hypothetical protein
MKLFGGGRAALLDDPATADSLGWATRRRSAPEPELVLRPREGDPRREPWIAPPGWVAGEGIATLLSRRQRSREWSFLPQPAGVLRYLEQLARPCEEAGVRVALAGLGRVGGMAAAVLAATPTRRSGIRELLVLDNDAANQERWLLELGSIAAWRSHEALPRIRPTTVTQAFRECDLFLFAATTGVPPLGSEGDVRLVQFAPNRAIMREFLDQALAAAYTGLFLIVSDPVDTLAQAAFFDSNSDSAGGFTGRGLAPERIAGLGLGVMWARAMAQAKREGREAFVSRFGGAFGPHNAEVVAFDDLRHPDTRRSESLSRAARECNFLVRQLGFLPFVGPGVSSVALALPPLFAGRQALASVFVDGVYFGAPARLQGGVHPVPVRLAPAVTEVVARLYARLGAQARDLGLVWD